MFLASVLLFAEWNMERFTPPLSKIDRRWKPDGMSWFARANGRIEVEENVRHDEIMELSEDQEGGQRAYIETGHNPSPWRPVLD